MRPIDDIPTIGLLKYGTWLGKGIDVRCSECGNSPIREMDADGPVWFWSFKPPHCPNCGAIMCEERQL